MISVPYRLKTLIGIDPGRTVDDFPLARSLPIALSQLRLYFHSNEFGQSHYQDLEVNRKPGYQSMLASITVAPFSNTNAVSKYSSRRNLS